MTETEPWGLPEINSVPGRKLRKSNFCSTTLVHFPGEFMSISRSRKKEKKRSQEYYYFTLAQWAEILTEESVTLAHMVPNILALWVLREKGACRKSTLSQGRSYGYQMFARQLVHFPGEFMSISQGRIYIFPGNSYFHLGFYLVLSR